MTLDSLTGILDNVEVFGDITYLDLAFRNGFIKTFIYFDNNYNFEKDLGHMVSFSSEIGGSNSNWVIQKYKSLRNSVELHVMDFVARQYTELYGFD